MHRSFFPNLKSVLAVAGLSALAAGCGDTPSQIVADASPGRVRYVVGSFEPGGADPVSTTSDGVTVVDLKVLASRSTEAARAFRAEAGGGRLDGDALDRLLDAAWNGRSVSEPDLASFAARTGYRDADDDWLRHEVVGSMTPYRRRLHVPRSAVRAALLSFAEGRGLRYPEGTAIVGEHLDGDRIVETTAMIRRPDGYWDFAAYGPDGSRISVIRGHPDDLRVPGDCYGCHYGDRAFEPERSFPAAAPDGPLGARFIDVPPEWQRADVTARLDEHARRDDGVLGLYATLWLSSLVSSRDAGRSSPADAELVARLGF